MRVRGRKRNLINRGGEIPVAESEQLLQCHPAIENVPVTSVSCRNGAVAVTTSRWARSRAAAGLRSTTLRYVSSLGPRPTLDRPSLASTRPESLQQKSLATHLTRRSTSVVGHGRPCASGPYE